MRSSPLITESKWTTLVELGILMASLVISAGLILSQSGVVPGAPMDQHFVETVDIQLRQSNGRWIFHYPNLQHAGGITSSLVAGLYKLIIPTNHDNLNWHFCIFSMVAMLVSSFYLFRVAIVGNWALRTAAYLLVASSGFQLLQPSSEVLSAAFLNLFVVGILKGWPRPLSAFFLALFGLGKVELTLAAALLSVFWSYWESRRDGGKPWLTLLSSWGWMALFLSPGLVLEGANPFQSGRSSTAFMSAYSWFLRAHQFQSTAAMSDPELVEAINANVFPGAKSFPEIVIKHPVLYGDFLGISAVRSAPNVLKVFKFMLIPFLVIALQWKKVEQQRLLLFTSILATLAVLIPAWMVIFVRMRYIAKVLPLVVAAVMACALELRRMNNRILPLTWVCTLSTIGVQLLRLIPYQD